MLMFTKSQPIENFLIHMGAAYYYTDDILLSMFCKDWDKENLSRPVVFRPEAVKQYASLFAANSPAPALIVHKLPNGTYEVLDGRQRIKSAVQEGIQHFAAYVVETDSEDLLLAIKMLANSNMVGHPEPLEWRKSNVVDVMILQRGWTAQEVARSGGWQVSDVETIAENLRWKHAITAAGGPDVPQTLVEVLMVHTTKEEFAIAAKPISEFLRKLKACRFSANDAEPYVEDFFKPFGKKSRAHTTYTNRLNKFLEDEEVVTRLHGRKGGKQPRAITIRRGLKIAHGVLENMEKESETLLNVDEFFQWTKKINDLLKIVSRKKKK